MAKSGTGTRGDVRFGTRGDSRSGTLGRDIGEEGTWFRRRKDVMSGMLGKQGRENGKADTVGN